MKTFINRFMLLTFVTFALVISGFAQGKLNIADQVSLVTEFEVNGLKVLVKNRPNAPTVAAGLFIKGGARNITDKNAGIEALMIDSALEASKNYSREMVRRELAATGSQIGGSASVDYSVFSFGSTRQFFDDSWKMFADLVMNPKFDKTDVDRLRQQTLTGLRERETDNDNFLNVLQERIIYTKHPYENNVSGTIENITNFTPQELSKYHKKVLQTSQLLLVIVGDVDVEEFKTKVTNTFGKLPKGNYKDKALPKFDFSKPTLDITKRDTPTNYIRGIFEAPSINDPDYYAMRVVTTILTSQFFQEVRERRQLTYAANATLDSYLANSANIYVTTTDANQSVQVMLDIINDVKTRELNPTVIKSISSFFLTNYYVKNETNAAQAGELAKYELVGGGWRNSFEFLNGVQGVTPKDIQRVSRKYLKNIRFVVIGNPQQIDEDIFLQKKSDKKDAAR